jgi:CRISPR associated protein
MYEVRLHLNRRSRDTRRFLEQPYLFHKLLEAINPERTRVLWRLMNDKLLVRSSLPLEWKQLDVQHSDFGERTHGTFKPEVIDGGVQVVNLLAYARKRPVLGPWKPKTPDEYLEWFRIQGTRYGFDVLESTVIRQEPYYVETRSMPITILPVELIAAIRVNNSPKFQLAFEAGIGRMRAYGCGLLLTRPAPTQ